MRTDRQTDGIDDVCTNTRLRCIDCIAMLSLNGCQIVYITQSYQYIYTGCGEIGKDMPVVCPNAKSFGSSSYRHQNNAQDARTINDVSLLRRRFALLAHHGRERRNR